MPVNKDRNCRRVAGVLLLMLASLGAGLGALIAWLI
jgi:hypothetical protein